MLAFKPNFDDVVAANIAEQKRQLHLIEQIADQSSSRSDSFTQSESSADNALPLNSPITFKKASGFNKFGREGREDYRVKERFFINEEDSLMSPYKLTIPEERSFIEMLRPVVRISDRTLIEMKLRRLEEKQSVAALLSSSLSVHNQAFCDSESSASSNQIA